MDETEKISVIIPCFNNSLTLRRAVTSAMRSSWKNMEIVIVDDGSSDKPESMVLDLIDDSEVKLLHKQNGGLGSARDYGVRNSKGRFIAFLDADDEMSSLKIGKQREGYAQFGGKAIVFSGTQMIYETGTVKIKKWPLKSKVCDVTEGIFRGKIRPSVASIFMKRDLYDGIGGFSKDIRRQSEFEFLCRAIKEGVRFLLVNEPLYIQHASMTSNRYQGNYRANSIRDIFRRLESPYFRGLEEKRKRDLGLFVQRQALILCYGSLVYDRRTRTEILEALIRSSWINFQYKPFFLIFKAIPSPLSGISVKIISKILKMK
jgi:glycosyltransferase involved in cell wall biosynthesis